MTNAISVPKEKGAARGHALWLCASVDQSSGVSVFLRRCRRFISRCNAVTTNCPILSPSSLSLSTESATSCGTRTSNLFDFALTAFVAISEVPMIWCPTIIHNIRDNKTIDVSDTIKLLCVRHFDVLSIENNEARQCVNTNRASDHYVTEINAMAKSQCNQTHPKNRVFIFLAVIRANQQARPHREEITAASEREARKLLAGRFVLVFAGCLPVREVNHA